MRMYLVTLLTLALTSWVSGHDLVEVKWGVADSTAEVGRLFKMHVPSDAFSGPVKDIEITSSEGKGLPEWLEFSKSDNLLTGIPLPRHAGPMFLDIVAKGPSNEASVTFSLVVRDVPSHTAGAPLKFKSSGPETVRCKHHEPETVATIIIDLDLEQMLPGGRMGLLKKFLNHMDLHEDMVKLLPVGKSSMRDANALVSGSGDCEAPKTAGTFISWPVGCGQVKSGHMPILQRLDEDSSSGHMAKVLQLPIIGWHVTNSHIQAPKRKRRQVMATATPVATPIMPTKTDGGADKTDDPEDGFTRTVPDMTSIQPTATQPDMPKTDEPEMTTPMTPKEVVDDKTLKPTEVMPPKTTPKETPAIEPTMTYTEPSDVPSQPPVAVVGILTPKKPLLYFDKRIGDIIDISLDSDLFKDTNTDDLQLMLFREGMADIAPDFFLQLDEQNKKIVGLPFDDTDKGMYHLFLVAKKMEGGKQFQGEIAIDFKIKSTKGKGKINHELAAVIDMDFNKFKSSIANQTLLATKVASLYGDPDSSNLLVTKMEAGSVVYGWTNKTTQSKDDCPVGDISSAVDKLVVDGKLTDEAVEKMKPFKLQGISSTAKGKCVGNKDFPTVNVDNRPAKGPTTPAPATDAPVDPKEDGTDGSVAKPDDGTTMKPKDIVTEGVKTGSSKSDDNVLITTIVPAIVIVVILLIALLIACVLYRKKRKGNLNVEEQNTFVNKNTPVIFPNELEDKPSDVTKPLLVEGNAVPPPEYHHSNETELNNHSSNNGNNTQMNNLNSGDDIQEFPERPYEPPTPPVTDSSSKQPPRPAQQPFSQPPQILP